MDRITDKHLERMADRINELLKTPKKPWVDGVAQIGNHHISHAYGGVCLHRMHNAGGGVTTPIISYHTKKRHLY